MSSEVRTTIDEEFEDPNVLVDAATRQMVSHYLIVTYFSRILIRSDEPYQCIEETCWLEHNHFSPMTIRLAKALSPVRPVAMSLWLWGLNHFFYRYSEPSINCFVVSVRPLRSRSIHILRIWCNLDSSIGRIVHP